MEGKTIVVAKASNDAVAATGGGRRILSGPRQALEAGRDVSEGQI